MAIANSVKMCVAERPNEGIAMDFIGRCVLLVEDNAINREIAIMVLQE